MCKNAGKVVRNSTTFPWINWKVVMVSEGSLFFKLVLAQGAKCRIFVTKGHQLSPGLPKMNLVTFGRGGGKFFNSFA